MYQQPPNDQPAWQQPQHTQYPQQPPYQQTGPGVPPPPQYYPTGGLPPQYPMPPRQPPRQPGFFSRRAGCLPVWGWLLLAVLAIGAIGSAARGNNTPATNTPAPQATTQVNTQANTTDTQPAATDTPAPTPTPTKVPKWVTTHTFSGTGNKKTAVFSAPNDWKILWKCQGFTDGTGISGSMYVSVYNSDSTMFDYDVVSADCKAGGWTSDNTEEHQSGDVYLDIGATGQWSMTIQEFK